MTVSAVRRRNRPTPLITQSSTKAPATDFIGTERQNQRDEYNFNDPNKVSVQYTIHWIRQHIFRHLRILFLLNSQTTARIANKILKDIIRNYYYLPLLLLLHRCTAASNDNAFNSIIIGYYYHDGRSECAGGGGVIISYSTKIVEVTRYSLIILLISNWKLWCHGKH
jgi:hypothetical protein